ncbi:hypothetical protein ACROYT_G020966 [Oculina patagonica]
MDYMGRSPIFRDIAMAVGAVNVLTQQGPGHSVAIVIGGVSDALNTNANSYVLTVERRRGFVKLALETGSPLVPVFGFGQNNVFRRLPKVSFLHTYIKRVAANGKSGENYS